MALADYYFKKKFLPKRTEADGKDQKIIALLSSSSLDFMVSWFAILQLGMGALLVAYVQLPLTFGACLNIEEDLNVLLMLSIIS